MTKYIAEAVGNHDGRTGDSGGLEVRVTSLWDYSTCCGGAAKYTYRNPNHAIVNRSIKAAVAICANNNIGYWMDTTQRTTSYKAFAAIGWDVGKISSVGKCDIDCSEMMACCCNFGFGEGTFPSSAWTGDIGGMLEACGWAKRSYSESDLMPGDIIVAHNSATSQGHTGMYIGTSRGGDLYEEQEPGKAKNSRGLKYRVHQGGKWLDWVRDGQTAGIPNCGMPIKAIQIESPVDMTVIVEESAANWRYFRKPSPSKVIGNRSGGGINYLNAICHDSLYVRGNAKIMGGGWLDDEDTGYMRAWKPYFGARDEAKPFEALKLWLVK